ncbi:TetR/AcrR family transcriptional regulator, partial [Micromonospora sp. KC213]
THPARVFEFGLARILDGVAALIGTRAGTPPSTPPRG